MGIEEKIKELEIKKLLIVDDKLEHIEAAKQYFKTIETLGVTIDYASSGKEAKEKIRKQGKQPYTLVLSDLTMEEGKTGLEVMREAISCRMLGYIVTGFEGGQGHGYQTHIHPYEGGSIRGKKDQPGIWEQVFEGIIKYLTTDKIERRIFEATKRAAKYMEGPFKDDEFITAYMNSRYAEIKR
jgi:hypothetical protein